MIRRRYGANIEDLYRRTGIYAGRLLNGEKPSDLPIERATKFEFIVNMQTAKAFDLIVPPGLVAVDRAVAVTRSPRRRVLVLLRAHRDPAPSRS